ncbi:hypothetical protein L7F22_040491, partial [Adiantum nelumboides]|nr:hypothetical protein [Adiantum nelumboides]
GSHIGIDINTLKSLNVTDTSPSNSTIINPFYPQLFLYNNSTFTAWVEFNASTQLIQVWMSNHSTAQHVDRPLHPCLQLQHDLSAVFSQKLMYVGFSATSQPHDRGMEGVAIYAWSFYSETAESPAFSNAISPTRRNLALYVGLPLTAAVLVLAGIIMTLRGRNQLRKRASALIGARIETALQTARPFSYQELWKATNGFDEMRKVGEGGYGSVYRGILSDSTVVAVKKLKKSLRLEAHFCTEASIIRKVRHRYLLELQGWCYEDGKEALL